jgi:hypothetical protein
MKYESNVVNPSKSLYAIIIFGGIQHIYLTVALKIPARVQFFVWLFSKNKIITRNNLRRRGVLNPLKCGLC